MSEHMSDGGNLDDTRSVHRTRQASKPPSSVRVATWIIVAAVGLYLLGSGIIGILSA